MTDRPYPHPAFVFHLSDGRSIRWAQDRFAQGDLTLNDLLLWMRDHRSLNPDPWICTTANHPYDGSKQSAIRLSAIIAITAEEYPE